MSDHPDIVETMADALTLFLSRPEENDLAAKAALSALEKAGYCVVPVKPTEEMVDAGCSAEGDGNLATDSTNIYTAMIEAGRRR
jgi:hypothetical protein